MKTMTVAFIGHRNLRQNRETAKIINTVIYKLINEVNAETFLFGGVGHFDDVSLAVVTYLKQNISSYSTNKYSFKISDDKQYV